VKPNNLISYVSPPPSPPRPAPAPPVITEEEVAEEEAAAEEQELLLGCICLSVCEPADVAAPAAVFAEREEGGAAVVRWKRCPPVIQRAQTSRPPLAVREDGGVVCVVFGWRARPSPTPCRVLL